MKGLRRMIKFVARLLGELDSQRPLGLRYLSLLVPGPRHVEAWLLDYHPTGHHWHWVLLSRAESWERKYYGAWEN